MPHGLAIIDKCINKMNYKYFIRSDISSFFDNVPRDKVINILSNHIEDDKFLNIIDMATCVVLKNENELGEDRKVFPLNYEGVAQGSLLSPLFGNILLKTFDEKFNHDDVVCVRFIDDFVLLSNNSSKLNKEFNKVKKHLKKLGLNCHDPFNSKTSRKKAEHGKVEKGFDFLGYKISRGQFQPSSDARKSLMKKLRYEFNYGKRGINYVINACDSFEQRQRFVQTLNMLDKIIHGWGDAFAYSNVKSTTLNDLDKKLMPR